MRFSKQFITGACLAMLMGGYTMPLIAGPKDQDTDQTTDRQEKRDGTGRAQQETNRAARQEKREGANKDRQEARKNRKQADTTTTDTTQTSQDKTDRKAAREKNAEKVVDKRQDHQEKRIEQGVKNGSLTTEELSTLTNQQNDIVSLEQQFKSDGKITRDEFKQLNDELNTASRCIFADKHNTSGNQMPVYRFGENVKLNSDTAVKLADPNLDKTQVRQITHDFHEMLHLKHALATEKLTDEQRTKLQSQYDQLLNEYFTLS